MSSLNQGNLWTRNFFGQSFHVSRWCSYKVSHVHPKLPLRVSTSGFYDDCFNPGEILILFIHGETSLTLKMGHCPLIIILNFRKNDKHMENPLSTWSVKKGINKSSDRFVLFTFIQMFGTTVHFYEGMQCLRGTLSCEKTSSPADQSNCKIRTPLFSLS